MGYQDRLNSQRNISELFDEAPFLGSDFDYEIACGNLWSDNYNFLSEEEKSFLHPQDQDDDLKLIDPNKLKIIFEKILSFLEREKEKLSFEIELDFAKMRSENLDTDLYVNGIRCWIQGDSAYYQVEPKFRIINLPGDQNVEEWVAFKEEIIFDGNKYYLKKITRLERYKNQILQIIEYCNKAVELKTKVYWYRED